MHLISKIKSERFLENGQISFNNGDLLSAIEFYNKALELFERDYRIYLHLALAQSRNGNLDDALKTLQKVQEIAPNQETIFLYRGKILYEHEQYEEAIKEFDKCIEINHENQIGYNYKAFSLFKLARTAESIHILKQSDISNNLEIICYFCMIFEKYFFEKEGTLELPAETAEEENSTETENEIKPLSFWKKHKIRHLLHKGDNYFYNNEYDKALKVYEKAYKINNNEPDVLGGLGVIYFQKEKYEESLNYLLKAAKYIDDNPMLFLYLGRLYLKFNRIDKAIENFLKIEETGPEDYNKYYYLGVSYILKDDKDTSFSYFKKAFTEYFIDNFEECFNDLKDKVMQL